MSTLTGTVSDPGVTQDVAYALQLCIGGVFVASLLPKLRQPKKFGHTVARYEVLPRRWTGSAAGLVMVAEGLLALSFITGIGIAAGVALGAALLSCFGIATAINLKRGRDIDCGCFGASGEKISPRSLVRLGIFGLALLVLAGLLASGQASAVTPLGWMDSGADLGYTLEALGVVAALTLAAVWVLEIPTLRDVVKGPQSVSENRAIEAAEDVVGQP